MSNKTSKYRIRRAKFGKMYLFYVKCPIVIGELNKIFDFAQKFAGAVKSKVLVIPDNKRKVAHLPFKLLEA